MLQSRTGHVCESAKHGLEVLAIGGEGGLNTMEAFSTETGTWTAVGTLPIDTAYAAAVNIGERILVRTFVHSWATFSFTGCDLQVIGGLSLYHGELDSVYEIDTASDDYAVRINNELRLETAKVGILAMPLKTGWREQAKICRPSR